ncbi:MAG TPA: hypothetical protein VGF17_24385 [Phytomonospora sp.]
MNDTAPGGLDEARAELVEAATLLIAGGYDTPDDILDDLAERFADEAPELPEEEIRAIVVPMIAARRAEEAAWPERTGADLLDETLDELRGQGLTVEENFACCMRCGLSEIGGEAAEGSPGYVFFHEQDTEHAAAGQGLMLAYGAFGGDPEASAAIGRQVVAALSAKGLGVSWDGSVTTRIAVEPLDWRRRMPEE